MAKLNTNLPKRAVLVCPASEYPKMVELLEGINVNLSGRKLIETSKPMDQVIRSIQELVDTFRVTDFFLSSSISRELDREIVALCIANGFNHAEVGV